MIEDFKPHLSAKVDFEKLRFDEIKYLGSEKLDGIRTLNLGTGVALTRTLKQIPNLYVQEILGRPEFENLDGEIIVGAPNAVDVYRTTYSGVMKRDSKPDFKFYVFDHLGDMTLPYFSERGSYRYRNLINAIANLPSELRAFVELLEPTVLSSLEGLLDFERRTIVKGYEGIMVRHPDRAYKLGRSANGIKDQALMKLKRLESSEAEIIGIECEYANDNEATLDERGYTKRSSHKENKVPKDTLGKLYVRDVHSRVEFSIGVFRGYTKEMLKQLWDGQDSLYGKTVTYDFFPVGVKDKPRHPVMKGFRSDIDFDIMKA